MRTLAIATCGIALLLAPGCVTKSKYDALQKDLDNTKSEFNTKIEGLGSEIETLKGAIANKEAEIKERDAKINELESKIAALTKESDSRKAEISRLEGTLASVVKDRARLKSSANELRKALGEMSQRKAAADKRVAEFRNLLARFKRLIDSGKLKVKISRGRMVLELPTDVLFASGSAKLSDEGILAIVQITSVLASLGADRQFQIEGHTDNVPLKGRGRFKSNWELAAARATNVVEAMVDAKMPGTRVSAASYGEYQPVQGNASAEGRGANRRIEIVVMPDLSALPGFGELQKAVGAS